MTPIMPDSFLVLNSSRVPRRGSDAKISAPLKAFDMFGKGDFQAVAVDQAAFCAEQVFQLVGPVEIETHIQGCRHPRPRP